jgi:hypothetical protein
MRPALLLVLFAAACGGYGYIGHGAPPRVRSPRPFTLEVEVQGEPHTMIEDAVAWVLRSDPGLKRVPKSGDAVIRLEGKLVETRALLAGTDARFGLELSAMRGDEVVCEKREWKRTALSSGVPLEEERMVVEAVAWALGRAAATLGEVAPTAPPAAAEADEKAAPVPAKPTKRSK